MSIKAELVLDIIKAFEQNSIKAESVKVFEKILWNHATEIIANYRA